MEQQVMIDEVSGIQCGQRQPDESRREVSLSQRFPEQAAPLDVIVAVKVSAADRVRGKLESPEDEANGDG